MKMNSYPEIQALQKIYDDYKIHIAVVKDSYLTNAQDHPEVRFTINHCPFTIYIDDEYEDLAIGHPLLSLYLILREFGIYREEEDLLTWSNGKGLDPGNIKVLQYYKELSKTYIEIEQLLGKVDPPISDLDFQLNAGPAQALRTS